MGRGCAGWECLTTQACEALCFLARSPLGLWISLSVEMMEMRYVPKSLHTQSTHTLQRGQRLLLILILTLNFSFSDLDGVSN